MPKSHGEDTVGRSALFSLLAEAVRIGAAAPLTLYLVRALGPHGYGLYALAISIGVLACVLSDFGISTSTARFVAERIGNRQSMAAVVRDGLRVNLVLSAAVGLGLALLAGPIASAYGQPDLVGPLRAIAVVTFAQTVFQVLVGISLGMRRNALQARLYALEGFTETTAAITFVAVGGGATAALLGQSLGYAVAASAGLIAILRMLGRAAVPRMQSAGHARRILGYAGSALILNVAFTLFAQIDVLLITAYLGATAAGQFQAPSRLILMLMLVGQAVSNGVSPRAATHRSEPESAAAVAGALRALVLIGLLGTAVVMVWSRPIGRLALGDGYGPSANVLLASGPFIFFGILGPLVTVSLTYLGFARQRVPIAIGALVMQVVLDVILIPTAGIVGSAVASDITYALYLAAHFRLLRAEMRLDMRVQLRTLRRGVGAAAAAAAVLAAFGTGRHLSPVSLLAGGVLAIAAWAIVLSVTREVSRNDLRSALGSLRRRPREQQPEQAADSPPAGIGP